MLETTRIFKCLLFKTWSECQTLFYLNIIHKGLVYGLLLHLVQFSSNGSKLGPLMLQLFECKAQNCAVFRYFRISGAQNFDRNCLRFGSYPDFKPLFLPGITSFTCTQIVYGMSRNHFLLWSKLRRIRVLTRGGDAKSTPSYFLRPTYLGIIMSLLDLWWQYQS